MAEIERFRRDLLALGLDASQIARAKSLHEQFLKLNPHLDGIRTETQIEASRIVLGGFGQIGVRVPLVIRTTRK